MKPMFFHREFLELRRKTVWLCLSLLYQDTPPGAKDLESCNTKSPRFTWGLGVDGNGGGSAEAILAEGP